MVVVESVKVVSEVYVFLFGEVVDVNLFLGDVFEIVNVELLGVGWFFKIKIVDVGELENFMFE